VSGRLFWGGLLAIDGKASRRAQDEQVVTLTHPARQSYRGSQLDHPNP